MTKNDKSSKDEIFVEVDVDDEDMDKQSKDIEIDPLEEEKKRVETEILTLIEKGKIDLIVEKYQDLLIDLKEERKLSQEYLNTAQLVQAEFENYKKRAYKDQEFSNHRNKASILQKFLKIYEDLDRTHLQTSEDSDIEHVREALTIVFRNMKDSLSDLGVKVIDPKDEIFDPKYHEALYTTENAEIEDNKIVEVISKGFILDSIVLKPARVVISKQPKKAVSKSNSD